MDALTYLGRGVSAQLGDRRADVDRLRRGGLPVLATPADVAAALEMTPPELRRLAFHAELARRVHYTSFTVPKRGGGERTLSAPHAELAAAQQWILRQVLDRATVSPAAHGFVAGRGILTNARPHAGQAVVVNLDLKAFFPSIDWTRVRGVFRQLGYSPAAATVLALLCTECPRLPAVVNDQRYHVAIGPRSLPQGACTSPALSNQIARRLDRRLAGLACRVGLVYTRYADDLTFSGAAGGLVGYLMARVREVVRDEGFAVNETKCRVQHRGTAQSVTGLVVNDRPGVPRAEVRRLRAILHRATREGIDAQNRDGRPDFRAWLAGKVNYIGMVRPETGAGLKLQLHALLRAEAAAR